MITLQADNKGEGGIFSLYSLVKRRAKWLIIPAMIGGAALLADGIMTPAVTVSSAIEGLQIIYQDLAYGAYCVKHHCLFVCVAAIWNFPGGQGFRTNHVALVHHDRCFGSCPISFSSLKF